MILRLIKYLLIISLVSFSFPVENVRAWTWTATFEDGVSGTRAYGTTGFNGVETGTRTYFSDAIAHTGSQSCLFSWLEDDEGYSTCTGHAVYPSPVDEGYGIWIRAYYYFDSPWDWTTNGTKIVRTHNRNADTSHGLYNSIFSRGSGADDAPIRESSEPAVVDEETSSGYYFDRDVWQCIEMYVYNSSVVGNGIIRFWKNGVLILEDAGDDRTMLAAGGDTDFAFFMSTWNGGPVQNQLMYIDDIVITSNTPSNQDAYGNYMIGPTDWGSGTSISSPGNLTGTLQ